MAAQKDLPKYTVPSLTPEEGAKVAAILQERLHALNDLQLTLKHIHWNVVGPHFIAVHEMIDPQVDAVREMVDAIAERIATLGVSPKGTPGAIVSGRSWDDYDLGRASTIAHLGALDEVYVGVITAHREAATATESLDTVTNDLLIGHLHDLELFHWFVRAHLESSGGSLSTGGASTETGAAAAAEKSAQGKP
ncbi:Dps family protein [Cellulosimicrobium arenosum]|uniref:DNA starvation/stationary phase protection protein n=1 Tax=Cellulosimicrobium arenosum TaxID=2708133 RepID=A0A927G7C8_9MICO|nr:DNA starvation/stationary phase protection protein [Cellulosimicrobium arenosum]MBD8077802.1 DNA starvation/stationary phase protection protein [Cellulosimicrobium arenosum]